MERSQKVETKEIEMSEKPRKLTLWDTRNFVPLVNHEKELLPRMEVLGFHAKPPVTKICRTTATTTIISTWIVYTYTKSQRLQALVEGEQLPNPKLPYRLDGLHPSIYADFLRNVNFYLNMDDISELFHVRGIYISESDVGVKWRPIEGEGDIRLQNYFYKEGIVSNGNSNNRINDEDDNNADKNISIRSRGKVLPRMEMRPLKDIITSLSDDERQFSEG